MFQKISEALQQPPTSLSVNSSKLGALEVHPTTPLTPTVSLLRTFKIITTVSRARRDVIRKGTQRLNVKTLGSVPGPGHFLFCVNVCAQFLTEQVAGPREVVIVRIDLQTDNIGHYRELDF